METKICSKCNTEKDIEDFYKRNSKPISRCKECTKSSVSSYRANNLSAIKDRKSKYYSDNKEKYKIINKKHREENKEYHSEYHKKYREENLDKIKDYNRDYYKMNKDRIISKTMSYKSERKKHDVVYALSISLRKLINNSINRGGYGKKTKTFDILGCSFEEFKVYLESKFEHWMNWDNKGLYNGEVNYGWDIDHIIPTLSANNEEELIKLNHYTNLQPLCSYKNRVIKRNTMGEALADLKSDDRDDKIVELLQHD